MIQKLWIFLEQGCDVPWMFKHRQSGVVFATHWMLTVCFFTLMLSGVELGIPHPLHYREEVGNMKMPPDSGRLHGTGETPTHATHRLLSPVSGLISTARSKAVWGSCGNPGWV